MYKPTSSIATAAESFHARLCESCNPVLIPRPPDGGNWWAQSPARWIRPAGRIIYMHYICMFTFCARVCVYT